MDRKYVQDLQTWAKQKKRKPLVVWGARQVGKTYLIKHLFAKEYFKNYVYIDFKLDHEAAAYFSKTVNPDDHIKYIEVQYNKIVDSKTLLIFDEIQQCTNVLSSLKYYWQNHPEIPVIATGSMVRLSLRNEDNPDFLFPVGAISSMNLYPLTFDEYLLNKNVSLLQRIKKSWENKQPLEDYEHNLCLNELYDFLSIGGMPEPLDEFIETGSFIAANELTKKIYENYISDMSSYNVSNASIFKTRNVYNNIFKQLDKENKNFKISHLEKGKSNRDYFTAYQWLLLARVVYRSANLAGKVTLPLAEKYEGLFRLYLADEGMFAYQSKVSNADFFVHDKRNTLSGVFYENYVADELSAKDIPLFYWTGKQSHEFEFVVQNRGKALPIDVKKGKGKLNSLEDFRLHNGKGPAIKIHAGQLGLDAKQNILSVPLYSVFCVAEDIKNDIKIV